mmetsp:Transcript_74180/g.174099  ORF Transcript_74180/g.174099 Transcript_74180/m.174099 type:complete len:438 (+) Transcript_74180:657-1970(+)
MDHTSEDCHGSKSQGVPQNQEERLLRGSAEIRTLQGDLNVGVLVQELDALLEAPDETLKHLEDEDQHPVLLRLGLLLVVLEQVPDELDDSDDEGAECHRAQVVAEDHVKGSADSILAAFVGVLGEEPHNHSPSDDDLTEGDVQCVVPEVDEERHGEAPVEAVARLGALPAAHGTIDQLAALLVFPHTTSRPGARALSWHVSGTVGFGVGREDGLGHVVIRHLAQQEGRRETPHQCPEASNQRLHGGQDQYRRCLHHEDGSYLVDGNRQSNPVRQAADRNAVDERQNPKYIRKNLEDDSQLLAVDIEASVTNRSDLSNRVALLPHHIRILREAPNRLRLVAVTVLEGISAEVLDQIRVGVVGSRVERTPRVRDRSITPIVAQVAHLAVPLHACVVGAIQARKLFGSRGCLADGVFDQHCGRGEGTHHHGLTRLEDSDS